MTIWAVVPIKAPEQCKTRLSPVLSDRARQDLAGSMLRHVVLAAQNVSAIDKVFVLGPALHGVPPATPLLADPGLGLNAALASTMRAVASDVSRLIVIAADLPAVTPDDIAALACLDPETAAIAPDRAGHGTNALSLPLALTRNFTFHFGSNSFNLHCQEIARRHCRLHIIRSNSLALDIDEPADLDFLPSATKNLRWERT
jgi:2-phospho-L-lactate guanylyltransferase